jgi:hypothetical protein
LKIRGGVIFSGAHLTGERIWHPNIPRGFANRG